MALIVAIFANLIGLILGIVALVQSKKAGYKNGFAVAAIIVGAVLLVVSIIIGVVIVSQTVGAATACLNDPTGSTTLWGVTVPCSEVVR